MSAEGSQGDCGPAPTLLGDCLRLWPQWFLGATFLSKPTMASECCWPALWLSLLNVSVSWILTTTQGGRYSYYYAHCLDDTAALGPMVSHTPCVAFLVHTWGLLGPGCLICSHIQRQSWSYVQ